MQKKILFTVLSFFLILGMVCPQSFALDSSTYFEPGIYKSAETLPYGDDTIVCEFRASDVEDNGFYICYRFYFSSDSAFCLIRTSTTTGSEVSGKYQYVFKCFSNDPIYFSFFYPMAVTKEAKVTSYSNLASQRIDSEIVAPTSYKYFLGSVTHLTYNSSYFYTNGSVSSFTLIDSNYVGVVSLRKIYPSNSDIANEEQQSKLDEINGNVSSGFSSVNDQLSQIHEDITKVLSDGFTEIVNAGSDMPTLDTDNNWMSDSLDTIDGWLSDLSDFEEQLSSNEVENSKNLEQAGNFIKGFFSSIPSVIIAALCLFGVMIVVVKMIGR